MLEFLKSKTFFIHLLLSAIFGLGILMATYYWLGAYTNHGEMIVVPDIKGKAWFAQTKLLESRNLRLQVADSSIFIVDKPGGIIVEQDPAPGSRVKENRTIYVSVTKMVPPQVKIPSIIDVSDRQAEAILLSYGLKTGQRTYKPDLAKNAVLEVSYKGRVLKAGDEIPKGSVIDFVLGDGVGSTDVAVPDLNGRIYEEALFALHASGLVIGEAAFDDDVTDTLNAIIYRIEPSPGDSLKQGQSVKLYLKKGN